MQIRLLRTFTSQLCHTGHRLALALTLLDFLLNDLGNVTVDMQVVIHLLLDEITHILIDGLTTRSHQRRTQLNLGLTLKDRLLHIDGNGCHDASTDVAILILAKEVLNGLGNMFLESTLVGTALCGMLSVDKRVILFTILVGMGKGNLHVLSFQVDNRIKGIIGHAIAQQVFQSVSRQDATPVIHDGQSCVQISVVA